MAKKDKQESVRRESIVKAYLVDNERVITEDSNAAREFYNKSRFGILVETKVELGLIEAYYLVDKSKFELLTICDKIISKEKFFSFCSRKEKNFWVKYCVYKDLRDRDTS